MEKTVPPSATTANKTCEVEGRGYDIEYFACPGTLERAKDQYGYKSRSAFMEAMNPPAVARA